LRPGLRDDAAAVRPQLRPLGMQRVFGHLHLGEGEQLLHHGLDLGFLVANDAQILLPGLGGLYGVLHQDLRIGPDGRERAFQIVGDAREHFPPPLLLLLGALHGIPEMVGHEVHRRAGGQKFVRLRMNNGGVQITLADTLDPGHQLVHGFGDVTGDVAGEVFVRDVHAHRHRDRENAHQHPQRETKIGEGAFKLIGDEMQLFQSQTQLGQIDGLREVDEQTQTADHHKKGHQHRRQDHHHIGAGQAFFDRHGVKPPFCQLLTYKYTGRGWKMVKQNINCEAAGF